MVSSLIVLAVMSTTLIATYIHPIHLPTNVLNTIDIFAQYIWQWEGILPISSWMNDLNFIFWSTIIIVIVRIVIGLIALATGGGKPEV